MKQIWFTERHCFCGAYLISRSMMETWDCEVGPADLGIGVVLRRGGEILNQDNLHCLYKRVLVKLKSKKVDSLTFLRVQ